MRMETPPPEDGVGDESSSSSQRRQLHDAISGQGFDYHEVVDIAQQIKNGTF